MTIHGTTICAVRKDGKVAIAGDGQATSGEGGIVMKGNCRKVRRLYDGRIIIGFAGATADAFTLFELFEGKRGVGERHLENQNHVVDHEFVAGKLQKRGKSGTKSYP